MSSSKLKKYQNLIENSIKLYRNFNPSMSLLSQITPQLTSSLDVPF